MSGILRSTYNTLARFFSLLSTVRLRSSADEDGDEDEDEERQEDTSEAALLSMASLVGWEEDAAVLAGEV